MFVWPTTGSYITANFGWYSPGGYSTWHSGTDIGVSAGTQVFAAASGKVLKAVTVTTDPNGPYTSTGAKNHSFSAANGYGYGNYGYGNSAAIVLVLFILLVIIIGTRVTA